MSFEIADDQDSPALLTVPAQVIPAAQPTQRISQGVMSPAMLPPGRYVARARVMRGGNVAGVLVRPFIVDGSARGALPMPFLQGNVAKFDPKVAMRRDLLDAMLDSVAKSSPELKGPLAEARAGRYSAAALEALTAGDQTAAAFFKGLDWYSKGQLNEAATQLAARRRTASRILSGGVLSGRDVRGRGARP